MDATGPLELIRFIRAGDLLPTHHRALGARNVGHPPFRPQIHRRSYSRARRSVSMPAEREPVFRRNDPQQTLILPPDLNECALRTSSHASSPQ